MPKLSDLEAARKFPKEERLGFGASQADAKLSRDQMESLIKRGYIKMTSRGAGFCGSNKEWSREHTHFIRTVE